MQGKRLRQILLKFGFSYEISQYNHFQYFRYHFGSSLPRNPKKSIFRSFPTKPLMQWRFQHTYRWIWRFRGCLRIQPKRKKPSNWPNETFWNIRLSQGVFVILTMNEKKTGEMRSWPVFTTWISWTLNFIIRFKQCCFLYFGDNGGIGFKSGRQPRAAKIQPFDYLHYCSL